MEDKNLTFFSLFALLYQNQVNKNLLKGITDSNIHEGRIVRNTTKTYRMARTE